MRRPNDAVLSWAIYNDWALDGALEDYIDFHRFLLPRAATLNVACFDWFTKHPRQFVSAAAALRGSDRDDCEISDELLERVRARIDDMWRNGDGVVNEQQVARPSAVRREKKSALLLELRSSRYLESMLAEATEIFGQFRSLAQEFSAMAQTNGELPRLPINQ